MSWARPEWHERAACRDLPVSMFFPHDSVGARQDVKVRAALRVCAECPVCDECGAQAEANGERFGVWGGRPPEKRPYKPAPIAHGTNSGYQTHCRRGEAACGPCLQAHAEYKRGWKMRDAS